MASIRHRYDPQLGAIDSHDRLIDRGVVVLALRGGVGAGRFMRGGVEPPLGLDGIKGTLSERAEDRSD